MTPLAKAFHEIYQDRKFVSTVFDNEIVSAFFALFTMGYNAGVRDGKITGISKGYAQAASESKIRTDALDVEFAALRENLAKLTLIIATLENIDCDKDKRIAELEASIPTATSAGRPAHRLEWSESMPANDTINYNHVIASTPFGRILVTWKGWKEFDSPIVDEHPVEGFFYAGYDIDDAKSACEKVYFDAVNSVRPTAKGAGGQS